MAQQSVTTIDNIVVGEPLVSLESLGVSKKEMTVHIDLEAIRRDDGEIFLPAVLKKVGLFKSTGEVRQIDKQRQKSEKFKSDPDQNLWRTLNRPEFTEFKIGKRCFWLIVGEFK